MSKKTADFRRKVRQTSGTPEARAKLIPVAIVKGDGLSRQYIDTRDKRAPHGVRGAGVICTRPMNAEKRARLAGIKL